MIRKTAKLDTELFYTARIH
uniref:Uncharacterized protein n=1 Tax=Rhizophora mucronata TaxID=61149 RepID=A0A2P2PIT3_RHIMU